MVAWAYLFMSTGTDSSRARGSQWRRGIVIGIGRFFFFCESAAAASMRTISSSTASACASSVWDCSSIVCAAASASSSACAARMRSETTLRVTQLVRKLASSTAFAVLRVLLLHPPLQPRQAAPRPFSPAALAPLHARKTHRLVLRRVRFFSFVPSSATTPPASPNPCADSLSTCTNSAASVQMNAPKLADARVIGCVAGEHAERDVPCVRVSILRDDGTPTQ